MQVSAFFYFFHGCEYENVLNQYGLMPVYN